MTFLLDTNVVSELARPRPKKEVLRFLQDADGFLSVVSLHELRHGAELLKDSVRRRKLLDWLNGLRSQYAKNILPVDAEIAEAAAVLRAERAKSGRILHIEDALIAATAQVCSMTLVTRNIKDFEGCGVKLINPWIL